MDVIVVFADENNILRTELFDEAQKVTTVGAVPVGILGEDDGASESFLQVSCDVEGNLVGYRVSEETVLPSNRSDMLMASRLEWSGFVVNVQVLWEDAKERPVWVRDLSAIDDTDPRAAGPLVLVTDAGRVEPLASCAQAALAWSSLRSDSLHEVKFPHE
jgi:putative beta-1,4-xylosyltransferase IRX14